MYIYVSEGKQKDKTRKRVFLLESRLLDLVEQSGWYGGLLSESHNRRVSNRDTPVWYARVPHNCEGLSARQRSNRNKIHNKDQKVATHAYYM